MALVNFFGEYHIYFSWILPGVEACLLLNSQEHCCAQWRKASFLRSGAAWPLWFLKSFTNSLLLAAGEPKWHSSSLSARLPSYCDKRNWCSNCICLRELFVFRSRACIHDYKGFTCEKRRKNVGLLGLQLRGSAASNIEFVYIFCVIEYTLHSI